MEDIMQKPQIVKYSLMLSSAIFFWTPVSMVVVSRLHPGLFLIPIIMSILSIIGVLFIVIGRYTLQRRRYLLLPLILNLLFIILLGLYAILNGGSTQQPIEIAWFSGLLLLAPFSLGVFYAVRGEPKIREWCSIITLIMSIPVVPIIYLMVRYYPYGFDAVIVFLFVYWTFCMPIIGICYIIYALKIENTL
jgi:hypothetical protein